MTVHRLGYIDSMRGLAALAVIYFHTAYQLLRSDMPLGGFEQSLFRLLTQNIELGKVAVLLFFAVSGFVVPFSLDRSRPKPVREFVIGRFFRLYPAYWLSVLVMSVFLVAVLGMQVSPWVALFNLTMLQQFIGVPNLNDIYWTLQIELIFYGLCVGMFYFDLLFKPRWVFRMALLMLVAALLMAAARGFLAVALPVALPLALTLMFWGLLWRLSHLEGQLVARKLWRILTGAIVLGLIPVCIWAYSQDLGYDESWQRYLLTYYLALTLFVLLSTRLKLQHPVLLYLGAISYSLYLFGPIGQRIAELLLADHYSHINGHLVIALAIGLTLVIASLVYVGIEKPAIALGRQLKQRWAR